MKQTAGERPHNKPPFPCLVTVLTILRKVRRERLASLPHPNVHCILPGPVGSVASGTRHENPASAGSERGTWEEGQED